MINKNDISQDELRVAANNVATSYAMAQSKRREGDFTSSVISEVKKLRDDYIFSTTEVIKAAYKNEAVDLLVSDGALHINASALFDEMVGGKKEALLKESIAKVKAAQA